MCYISMNREDGLAEPEIVHEALPDDSPKRNSMNCPRCVVLALELDAELDEIHNSINKDVDNGAFSETIRY